MLGHFHFPWSILLDVDALMHVLIRILLLPLSNYQLPAGIEAAEY